MARCWAKSYIIGVVEDGADMRILGQVGKQLETQQHILVPKVMIEKGWSPSGDGWDENGSWWWWHGEARRDARGSCGRAKCRTRDCESWRRRGSGCWLRDSLHGDVAVQIRTVARVTHHGLGHWAFSVLDIHIDIGSGTDARLQGVTPATTGDWGIDVRRRGLCFDGFIGVDAVLVSGFTVERIGRSNSLEAGGSVEATIAGCLALFIFEMSGEDASDEGQDARLDHTSAYVLRAADANVDETLESQGVRLQQWLWQFLFGFRLKCRLARVREERSKRA
jgi:hypothetical protein